MSVIEEIAGHVDGRGSQTKNRYTLPYDLKVKKEAIDKLSLNSVIDFNKIKINGNW